MGDRAGQQGSSARASRLYPSLSFLEISVYTATWICGVMYSLYSLYRASLEQVSLLGLCFPQVIIHVTVFRSSEATFATQLS